MERRRRLVELLPKAELHVHLEGTMTPMLALDLACRNGHPLARQGRDAMEAFYRHSDFPEFLQHFKALTEVLQYPADLYELVRHYTHLARQSAIVYAELHLSPLLHISDRMPYALMMRAIQRGVEQAAWEGVQLRIILDAVRQSGGKGIVRPG